jgi:hypothetical protein
MILPTCGLIISAVCRFGLEVLETPEAGMNCSPIKTEPSKIGVSFANLRMILPFIHANYNG